jgi:hypothetical protein
VYGDHGIVCYDLRVTEQMEPIARYEFDNTAKASRHVCTDDGEDDYGWIVFLVRTKTAFYEMCAYYMHYSHLFLTVHSSRVVQMIFTLDSLSLQFYTSYQTPIRSTEYSVRLQILSANVVIHHHREGLTELFNLVTHQRHQLSYNTEDAASVRAALSLLYDFKMRRLSTNTPKDAKRKIPAL